MMTRKRAAIALVAIASLTQCGGGLGEGSQTQRAQAAPAPGGVLTQRQAVALRYLKFPQSIAAMEKRFGPPAVVGRNPQSTRYTHYYPTKSGPVAVGFQWGEATGLVQEGP